MAASHPFDLLLAALADGSKVVGYSYGTSFSAFLWDSENGRGAMD